LLDSLLQEVCISQTFTMDVEKGKEEEIQNNPAENIVSYKWVNRSNRRKTCA